MQQIIFEGYELLEVDGGGMSARNVAYTTDEKVAEQWKKKSHWCEMRSTRVVMNVIDSLDELDELDELNRLKLVESARAKLTKAELAALGLE